MNRKVIAFFYCVYIIIVNYIYCRIANDVVLKYCHKKGLIDSEFI